MDVAAAGTRIEQNARPVIIIGPSGGRRPRRVPMERMPRREAPGHSDALTKKTLDHIGENVAKARDFFSKYGLGEREGNGLINVGLAPGADNAAYMQTSDGYEQLIFGTHGESGVPYGLADDVVTHEYSHRVINNLVKLGHEGQSGLVGEHLADVFSAVLDDDDPWTIGEALSPHGLRSMERPEAPEYAQFDGRGRRKAQPGHIDDYVRTRRDNGGVHINVGIPNKAAAQIGQVLGRDKLGDIYMNAVMNHLPNYAGLGDAAKAVMSSTADLYGKDSNEFAAVRDAWAAVTT